MTQRNLHAVLAQVDRTSPLDSVLLSAALRPHAKLAAPLVNEQTDRAEAEALRNWLKAVSRDTDVVESSDTPPTVPAVVPIDEPIDEPKRSPPERDVRRDAARIQGADAPRSPDEFNRRFFPEQFEPAPPPTP
jgi:hypothetical protein